MMAGPSKPAPTGVPPEAARYLDRAAEELSELVKDSGFELKAYDQFHPDHSAWLHGLYGDCNDREICIQVLTDREMAPSFTAILRGYVKLYPPGDRNEWLLFETRRTVGLAGLLAGVTDLMDVLSLACLYRLPHPTDPDPKA